MSRIVIPELDKLIDVKIPVLDDGFIMLKDYMGNDQSIAEAARISYGQGTRKVSEDRHLIRYLMRHYHTTPFEMCELKLLIRVPMDCWRQWVRHRTASINEYSTRYSVAIDSKQKTLPSEWRIQSNTNNQGSSGYLDEEKGKYLTMREEEIHKFLQDAYEERLSFGVAREQARKDLPLSTYTEAYWKVDLHNLLHFLKLRDDSHAQEEIRKPSHIIGYDIVQKWVPIAWEAFLDYRVNSMSLTKQDIDIIQSLNQGVEFGINKAKELMILSYNNDGTIKRNREREELEAKLSRLNIGIPWEENLI